MTIAQTIKRMPTFAMQTSEVVPDIGVIIMDATSQKVKIGDGKSHLKDLPWVCLGIDVAKENTNKISSEVRKFIKDNLYLIKENNFEELFRRTRYLHEAIELAQVLKAAGIDLKHHMTVIPEYLKGEV